jgi:cell fate regulator YaaT (PSP1 superfamily)
MTSVIADNNNTNNAQIGLKPFFKSKVEALEIAVRDGTQNLCRLEAQRNELNSRGKLSLSLSLSLSLEKEREREVLFYSRRRRCCIALCRRAFSSSLFSLSVRLKTKQSACSFPKMMFVR